MNERDQFEQEAARRMAIEKVRQFPVVLSLIEKCWQRLGIAKIKEIDRKPEDYPEVGQMRNAIEEARGIFTQSSLDLLLPSLSDATQSAQHLRSEWQKIEGALKAINSFYSAFVKDRPVRMRRDGFTPLITKKVEELSQLWLALEPLI